MTLVDKGALGYEQSTRNLGLGPSTSPVSAPHSPGYPFGFHVGGARGGTRDDRWSGRQGGNISLAFDEADMAEFEDIAADARAAGLDARMLTIGGAADALPGAAGGFIGGLHVPSDGQASPQLVTAAFARAAREHGATLVENCAALSVETEGGRVSGG